LESTVDDINYEHDHHDWLLEVFGCEQNASAVQYMGDVATKKGHLLTFSNVFHWVLPFQLLDKTKSGHRKSLVLFLIDPHIRVILLLNVPCQQREWWAQEIQTQQGLFHMLPVKIQDEVICNVAGFPISIKEAKELRLELIEERKVFVQRHDQKFMLETFSLELLSHNAEMPLGEHY
jgi:hypothetical protein